MLRVLHNIAVAVDYLLCLIFWTHDAEPMTISSRCGLEIRIGRSGFVPLMLRGMGRILNTIDSGHCEAAIAADIGRAQAAINRLNINEPSNPKAS